MDMAILSSTTFPFRAIFLVHYSSKVPGFGVSWVNLQNMLAKVDLSSSSSFGTSWTMGITTKKEKKDEKRDVLAESSKAAYLLARSTNYPLERLNPVRTRGLSISPESGACYDQSIISEDPGSVSDPASRELGQIQGIDVLKIHGRLISVPTSRLVLDLLRWFFFCPSRFGFDQIGCPSDCFLGMESGEACELVKNPERDSTEDVNFARARMNLKPLPRCASSQDWSVVKARRNEEKKASGAPVSRNCLHVQKRPLLVLVTCLAGYIHCAE
ncbi:hypothetical protein V8F33_009380, partial [Rhypophila sp. PSN 637]